MTTFTGSESLINSIPLTYQTANPKDNVPLTANHFLIGQIGGRFAANHFLIGQIGGRFAPKVDIETNYNPQKRWRRVQELIAHFWNR